MNNLRFSLNIDKNTYESFVSSHIMCNLLQSYDWANVKDNWDHLYTGVYEKDKLIASSLVLIRHLPLGFTMFYLPRGPILDFDNKDLLTYFFNELKKVAKKYHCIFIKFDPGIIISSFHLNEEKKYDDYQNQLDNILSLGAIHYGFTQDFHATIQPRYHMVEYKEDFGMDTLSKKGKKNIKTAQKQNLKIKYGHLDLLDDFVAVMKCTEQRKNILLRGKEYYLHLLKTYKENAFITLAYFPIKEMLHDTELRYEKCLEDLKVCPENAKKKRFTLEELKSSLENKISQYSQDLNKYGEEICVAGTLSVKYGNTSEILYAGMNDEFKRLMAPYLTWYKTMEKCFEMGCLTSNMGGIEGDLKGGLVDFKEIFYPRINEFIGEFDLPVNRFLYEISIKVYKKRQDRLNK